jgi:hypothetical protein
MGSHCSLPVVVSLAKTQYTHASRPPSSASLASCWQKHERERTSTPGSHQLRRTPAADFVCARLAGRQAGREAGNAFCKMNEAAAHPPGRLGHRPSNSQVDGAAARAFISAARVRAGLEQVI